MSDWIKFDLSQIFPAVLGAGVTSIARLLDQSLSKTLAVDLDPSLDFLGVPNASDATVSAILTTLDALLKGGRVHALMIPIAKTYPNRPPTIIPSTLDGVQHALDINLGPPSAAAALAYAKAVSGTGGNAGFYQAFAESLYDSGDPNRPQYFNQSDAVAMVTLLVGAPTFSGVAAAASTLEYVFSPKSNTGGMTARLIPQPRGLRARAVATAQGDSVGVRLSWDLPKAEYSNEYVPGVKITVAKYAVIRSTDPAILSARSTKDLFGAATFTEGLTVGQHTVLALGTGKNAAYFDDSPPVDKPAYYTVSWEYTITEGLVVTTHAFDKLGEVTKVLAKAPPPAQTGRSPNWSVATSPTAYIPGLAVATKTVIEKSKTLLAGKPSTAKKVLKCIDLAEGMSSRLAARTLELIETIDRIGQILAKPLPGLFVTSMASRRGGNAYLLSELSKRLCDDTDTGRPRYDNGEYVCGICLVAGAPRYADLGAVIALFDLLFGSENAPSSDPLKGLLASIDTLVTQAEADVFGQDIMPTSPPSTGVAIDPLTGLPAAPKTTTFAADGQAISADDAANPEAGFTNLTPLKDLC